MYAGVCLRLYLYLNRRKTNTLSVCNQKTNKQKKNLKMGLPGNGTRQTGLKLPFPLA